jgi:hypothetical protein
VTADFDRVAASLRADSGDVRAYCEALAVRLEGALPAKTRVQRKSRKFLSREKVVRQVEVHAGENRYVLTVDDRGGVEATRSAAVRGIVLKNDPLPLDAWIDALAADLAEQAQQSEQERLALERLLL